MSPLPDASQSGLARRALPLLIELARRNRASSGRLASPAATGSAGDGPTINRWPAELIARSKEAGWIRETDRGPELTSAGRNLVRRYSSRRLARSARPDVPVASQPASTTVATRASAPSVNPDESPLAWLRRRCDAAGRPLLSEEQFEAGERLRRDFWLAGMTPRVTSSWTGIPQTRRERRGPPGAHLETPVRIVAARERVVRALRAVGTQHIGLLIDVLCHLKGLSDLERTYALPARSAKCFLQQALTELAYFYGLLRRPDVESEIRSRLRHWGTEDFRPAISPPHRRDAG